MNTGDGVTNIRILNFSGMDDSAPECLPQRAHAPAAGSHIPSEREPRCQSNIARVAFVNSRRIVK